MKLLSPFIISARLAPALTVGGATLSFDNGRFVLDMPDGSEHVISSFSFPQGRIHGDTNESVLQDGFASILSFLSACAESRSYAERRGKEPMEGENSDLFPDNVGQWAQEFSDEISMLELEITEQRQLIAS